MELKADAMYILWNYKSDYNFSNNRVNELDKLTQDLLHKLELNHLKYNEKARVAVLLAKVRQDRRYYKDIVDCYGTLVALSDAVKIGSVTSALDTAVKRIKNIRLRSYKVKIEEITMSGEKKK